MTTQSGPIGTGPSRTVQQAFFTVGAPTPTSLRPRGGGRPSTRDDGGPRARQQAAHLRVPPGEPRRPSEAHRESARDVHGDALVPPRVHGAKRHPEVRGGGPSEEVLPRGLREGPAENHRHPPPGRPAEDHGGNPAAPRQDVRGTPDVHGRLEIDPLLPSQADDAEGRRPPREAGTGEPLPLEGPGRGRPNPPRPPPHPLGRIRGPRHLPMVPPPDVNGRRDAHSAFVNSRTRQVAYAPGGSSNASRRSLPSRATSRARTGARTPPRVPFEEIRGMSGTTKSSGRSASVETTSCSICPASPAANLGSEP